MSALDMEAVVREAAASLGMLDASGQLRQANSLEAIDLIVEIENAANLEIPTEALREEAFASIESIAQMVRAIAKPL
jgi:acyl carrier protein